MHECYFALPLSNAYCIVTFIINKNSFKHVNDIKMLTGPRALTELRSVFETMILSNYIHYINARDSSKKLGAYIILKIYNAI